MDLNADFDRPALVRFQETAWVPSPMPGVERKMLDRIGGEVARATSLVRFAPGSAFSPHTHDGGEEFLVLDGVFQDEHGDFPAGSYIRNPPTSRHTPAAAEGALIFVKLHQFDPADRTELRVAVAPPPDGTQTLFDAPDEHVAIAALRPGGALRLDVTGGVEVFVLSGSVTVGAETLSGWDWLRLPPGGAADAVAGDAGATVWTKSRHLAPPRVPATDLLHRA